MAEQLILRHKNYTATIRTLGAELLSLTKDGQEYIWEGNPAFWKGHAPILFPICGGLKEDTYCYEGNSYSLAKHGFARFYTFQIEKAADDSATFLLTSSAEQIRAYPFPYALRAIFTLCDEGLSVQYLVTNTGNKPMYYSIGGHEGYACPGGIEKYSLVFDKEEDMVCHALDGNLLSYETYSVGQGKELPLKYDYFVTDALTFLYLRSRKITLKHAYTGEKLTVDFEGFPYVFVWTRPGADFICIEPWCGIPDFTDSNFDLASKKGICTLLPGKERLHTHKILL